LWNVATFWPAVEWRRRCWEFCLYVNKCNLIYACKKSTAFLAPVTSICEFCEHQCRENCVFHTVVNEIMFMHILWNYLGSKEHIHTFCVLYYVMECLVSNHVGFPHARADSLCL
jgi:hypothetical protein